MFTAYVIIVVHFIIDSVFNVKNHTDMSTFDCVHAESNINLLMLYR